MTKAFNRGDIVTVDFEPTRGRETRGTARPALVVSELAFNRLGLTYVAPITQGGSYAREAGFAVPLMGTGTKTQGVVLVGETKPIDLNERRAKRVESVPEHVIAEVLARLLPIFGG